VTRLLAIAASFLVCASAHGQLFRAYLSLNGSDSNPCTRPSPCRLLPAGLNAVADGGEIWLLDSANYNTATVSITKSVTILAVPGAVGSVVATGGEAININAAGGNVALRNLAVVPLPASAGTNGVTLAAGASLVVENCLIANLPGNGITVAPTTNTRVRIASSTIRGNALNGIAVTPSTSSTSTTFDVIGTNVDGNAGAGFFIHASDATANISGTIRNSRIAQNSGNGITVESGNGSNVTVNVSHASITNNNATGIVSNLLPAKVFVAGSTITGNTGTGLSATNGGFIESGGNNEVRNNDGGDASGVCPPTPDDAVVMSLDFQSANQWRLNSGQVGYAKLTDMQAAGGATAGQIQMGQTPFTPPVMIREMTISKCPGQIDSKAGGANNLIMAGGNGTCYWNLPGSSPLYTADFFQAPGADPATDDQMSQTFQICEAYSSAGQWYLNVRFTYMTCPFGTCGVSMQSNFSGFTP
jgi:hypothetical protein